MFILFLIIVALVVILGVTDIRRNLVTKPIFAIFKKILPSKCIKLGYCINKLSAGVLPEMVMVIFLLLISVGYFFNTAIKLSKVLMASVFTSIKNCNFLLGVLVASRGDIYIFSKLRLGNKFFVSCPTKILPFTK